MSKKRSEKKLEPNEESIESLLEPKSEKPASEQLSPEARDKLATLDPVRRYLLEISSFEPLTPEEEHRLAVLYQKQGDQQAAYRLITSNLRLVVQIARLYNRVYANAMDLIQDRQAMLFLGREGFKAADLQQVSAHWIKRGELVPCLRGPLHPGQTGDPGTGTSHSQPLPRRLSPRGSVP